MYHPAVSQHNGQSKPTPEDLKAVIGKWEQRTKAGQIVEMAANVVLLLDSSDIAEVEHARRIGDDKDTLTELIGNGRAVSIRLPSQVRMLDHLSVLCFAFSTLGMPCKEVPETLREVFKDVTSKQNVHVGGISAAEMEKRNAAVRKRFVAHDLSAFEDDTYALVRVISSEKTGSKGWVKLTLLNQTKGGNTKR